MGSATWVGIINVSGVSLDQCLDSILVSFWSVIGFVLVPSELVAGVFCNVRRSILVPFETMCERGRGDEHCLFMVSRQMACKKK